MCVFLDFFFKLQVPNIVKALHKQLKEKSIKSRQGCFSLLTELANVLPGCLADHVPALVPGKLGGLGGEGAELANATTYAPCLRVPV